MSSQKTFIDITGQQFGRWFVLRFDEFRNGRTRWICRCECGKEKSVCGREMRNGKSKSCGCIWILPNGGAAFNALISGYKASAKERGITWNLTREQVETIVKKECHYCGIEPKQVWKTGTGSSFTYNGIDRVDNKQGYEPENVVPCCKICNSAKLAMSQEDFYEWIIRIVQKYFPPPAADPYNLEAAYQEQWPFVTT